MSISDGVTFTVACGSCGREFTITASQSGLEQWFAGELIQKALPELTVEQRELLISRTCDRCFQEMFGLPE